MIDEKQRGLKKMAERRKEEEESLFPGNSMVENKMFDSEFIEKV